MAWNCAATYAAARSIDTFIGKVAIPDFILHKPGPLTVDEFTVMKTHTVQGAAAIAETAAEFPNARFLQMAHEIALYHHEKFDGSGYPFGLSGEEIPLAARIAAFLWMEDEFRAIHRSLLPTAIPNVQSRATELLLI